MLKCAWEGKNVKKTCEALKLAESTVKSHRERLFIKIHARNITHAVAIGFREGLFDTEDTQWKEDA